MKQKKQAKEFFSFDSFKLPMRSIEKPSFFRGLFLALATVLLGILPIVLIIVTRGSLSSLLQIWPLIILGTFLFIITLAHFRKKTVLTITEKEVCKEEYSLFKGRSRWVEPMKNYIGLLQKEEKRSSHSVNSIYSRSYTVFTVRLLHENYDKTFNLCASLNKKECRSSCERYCRILQLPALEEDEGELYSRGVGELDKSVRELVQEGKFVVEFDPTHSAPEELKINMVDNTLEIEAPKENLPMKTVIGAPFFIATLAGPLLYFPPVRLFGGFIVLIFIIIVGWIISHAILQPVMRIGKGRLHVFKRTRWGDTKGKFIHINNIESVTINSPFKEAEKDTTGSRIYIKTDDSELEFGITVSDSTRRWLKKCIIAVISHQSPIQHM